MYKYFLGAQTVRRKKQKDVEHKGFVCARESIRERQKGCVSMMDETQSCTCTASWPSSSRYNLNTKEGERFTFRSLAVSRINRFCWSRCNWKNLNLKRNQYLQFHTFRKGKKNIWSSGRDYIVVRRITCPTYLLNRDKFIEWNFEKETEGRKRETTKYAKRPEVRKKYAKSTNEKKRKCFVKAIIRFSINVLVLGKES